MTDLTESKLLALLMDFKATDMSNAEALRAIQSILSPLSHQDGASAEDVLGVFDSHWIETDDLSGGQHLMVLKVDALSAMHQFAQSETAKVVAEKDGTIEHLEYQVDSWMKSNAEWCEKAIAFKSEVEKAVAEKDDVIDKLGEQVDALQSELSEANEMINKLRMRLASF